MTGTDTSVIDRGDESGSALILALVVITAIGLMLAAILSFTDTSLLATPKFVAARNTLNDVDGAVDGAINSIRGSSGLGVQGFSLPCGPFKPYEGTPKAGITVDCVPQAGSGSASSEVPHYAILTLGTGSDGLIETGNAALTVDGGIYSNGVIDLTTSGSSSQRQIQVYGDVFAEGLCKPVPGHPESITTVSGVLKCSPGFTGDASGDDPGYAPGIPNISGLTIDPAGTCAGANTIVAFSPGLYTEIPGQPAGCNGSVWWFKPGTYYFDFPDARADWAPAGLPGSTLIGGTLSTGLSASTLASAIDAGSWIGKSCDRDAPGVQFIMGGPTTLTVLSGGSVELCGSTNVTNVDQHRIPFYGLRPEYGTRTATTATLKVTGTPVSPYEDPIPFTDPVLGLPLPVPLPPPAAKFIDNRFATASLVSPGTLTKSAAVQLPAFEQVPAGSTINSVKLRVRHFETDTAISASVVILPPTAGADTQPLNDFTTCSGASNCTDPLWDISAKFKGRYGYRELNGLKVVYRAELSGNNLASDNLDGVELVVDYTPPGFEATTCPTSTPACNIVTSTVTQNLFFHGTVYVPRAALSLRVHNKDTTIFDRGVIARSLTVDVSSGSKQVDSPFQLPKATTGRKVLFIGKDGGVEKVRALVTYQDYRDKDPITGLPLPSNAFTAFPGYEVKILNWSVLR
jgi:hypothetical protein